MIARDDILRALVAVQYSRNDVAFERGTFRVRGDTVEIFPAGSDDRAVRIEFWGDEIESIRRFDILDQRSSAELNSVDILPVDLRANPLIAAAGDQVPPGAVEHRIEMMRDLVETHGRY